MCAVLLAAWWDGFKHTGLPKLMQKSAKLKNRIQEISIERLSALTGFKFYNCHKRLTELTVVSIWF